MINGRSIWAQRFCFAVGMAVLAGCGAAAPDAEVTAKEKTGTVGQKLGTPGITTDQPSYAKGTPIQVSFSNLPGNTYDWVGIFPPGGDGNSYVDYQYTGGLTDGSLTFSSPTIPGGYEVRAYADNSATDLLATSAGITITGVAPTVQSSASSYGSGAPIVATFDGLPGNQTDWVGVYVNGDGNESDKAWAYTNGQVSGSVTLTSVPAGTYELRVFAKDSFQLLGTSGSFTVGSSAASLSASKSSYASGETVTATFDGLPGNQTDWIGVYTPGDPAANDKAWIYTGGQVSGSLPFPGLAMGTYELRAFAKDSFDVLVTSSSFTVAATASSVAASQDTFNVGDPIVATVSGMPGNQTDWIGVYAAGDPDTADQAWGYTAGQTSGNVTLSNIVSSGLPAGTYELRAFSNDSWMRLAVSTSSFTVQ